MPTLYKYKGMIFDRPHMVPAREFQFLRNPGITENFCEECGITESQHLEKYSTRLFVHHLNEDHEDNRESNLHIVCRSCHKSIHNMLSNPVRNQEVRDRISKSNSGENSYWYGREITDEHRRNLSKAKSGENHPLYGVGHTDEARRKIGDATIRSNEVNPHLNKLRGLKSARTRKINRGDEVPTWMEEKIKYHEEESLKIKESLSKCATTIES